MWKRAILVAVTTLVTFAVFLYFWQVRPAIRRGKQVRTLADMQLIVHYLDVYRTEHHEYPTDLRAAVPPRYRTIGDGDAWGYPWQYETRQGGFVLLSVGLDGKADGTDYWELRGARVGHNDLGPERVAGVFTADQVVTDCGWLREAGK